MCRSQTCPRRFVDVAVTFTADQFQGIYRGKKHHEPDFAKVIQRAQEYGCEKMILTTMTLLGAYANHQLVKLYPGTCTMTLGVHPYHAGEIYAETNYLDTMLQFGHKLLVEEPSSLVAFGEIGLDYDHLDRADKETQRRAFRDQLDMAVQLQLPLFLHARNSVADLISILKPYLPRLPRGGLVHSFAGTKDEMLQLIALGLEISVNGVCFRTDEQLDMVRHIPLDRLQLETDAPWCEIVLTSQIEQYLQNARPLPPSRKHSKFIDGQMVKGRNESCIIERVAIIVAGLKELPIKEVVEAAWNNSVRMFRLV